MFDFLIRKSSIRSAQKMIDRLNPTVNLHVPEEHSLSSVTMLKKYAPVVAQVKSLEDEISKLSDDQLRAKTDDFKARYKQAIKSVEDEYYKIKEEHRTVTAPEEKESLNIQLEAAFESLKKMRKKVLDEILPEAFAVAREAGKRVLNMRHFDVQILGGIVLHNGDIAEMTTGEGKTLVATLPTYLNGLTGEGVHVVTVNDYLARRDCEWMGPLYEFLGLTIGVIQHDMSPPERKEAYGCEITYGTNNEFGFDYLRDNMVSYKEDMVQRSHYFSVVDEVDSILVDEARTPLIISGPAEESTDKYYKAFQVSKQLKGRKVTEKDEVDAKYQEIDLAEGYDYLADEKNKGVSLTDDGEEKTAKLFGVENLHDMETIEYRHHILQALKAKEFFMPDVDYVVKDGEVIIVDEFTGRMMPGRRWSDGLHQAVEAKEGIKIERENQTLATITFQNYFRLYEKLSGMTGTAYTEATEFKQIYNLEVVAIPTNKPLQRKNYPDGIYRSLKEKYDAVVADIEQAHKEGQPVLVGTISIEKSEHISRLLKEKGVPHQVLNAKFHEQEAQIISQAGRKGAVTIATNMAGRGTDIVLGGNAEYLAKNLAETEGKNASEEDKDEMTSKFIAQFAEQCKKEHDEVVEIGGLWVMGTERHESRRIDNQLRGRQGRQGDPGASRFYVSLEDDLMRLFASDKVIGIMDKLGMEEGQVLEHPWLSKALENAQRRVESHNFEIRKHLLEYDDVMTKQREVIYNLRRSVLESDDVKYLMVEAIEDVVHGVVAQHLFMQSEEMAFDIEGLDVYFKSNFGYSMGEKAKEFRNMAQAEVVDVLFKDIMVLYDRKEQDIGSENTRQLEKMLLLNTIDLKWKDHLYAMDQLKEGVGLRSYGQRNPLTEYKNEGFDMFRMMYSSVHQEVAELIFKLQPVSQEGRPRGVFSSVPQNLVHDNVGGLSGVAKREQPPQQHIDINQQAAPLPNPSSEKSIPIKKSEPKVGRNDSCPCGSGKKYKKCHGK